MTNADPRKDRTAPAPAAREPLDDETLALVRRAASVPRGLVLLLEGPLECAAVILRVHPRAVEAARRAVEDPAARAAALEAFSLAASAAGAASAAAEAPARPARTPESIVREAERRADGLVFLTSCAPECAAILFGVTPDVVLAARELLARRGWVNAPEEATRVQHRT